jgi:hypothetical protein
VSLTRAVNNGRSERDGVNGVDMSGRDDGDGDGGGMVVGGVDVCVDLQRAADRPVACGVSGGRRVQTQRSLL